MFDYGPYLRKDKFPLIWCPGCGDGIALKAILKRSLLYIKQNCYKR